MKIVVFGATGAVGTQTVLELIQQEQVQEIHLLVRRKHEHPQIFSSSKVIQHVVDVFHPASYREFLQGMNVAVNTFGVGEPSKISKQEFYRIDFECVRAFAQECKTASIPSFVSLGAVGADIHSKIYYVKVKAELEQALKHLNFEILCLFQPSMIMTPTNRYGFTQGLALAVYPYLDVLLMGPLKKYRSVRVEKLGQAIARKAIKPARPGVQVLTWTDFQELI